MMIEKDYELNLEKGICLATATAFWYTRERFRRFVCDCVEKRSLKRCELGAGVVVI